MRASYIRGFRNGKINGREVVVEDVLDAMGLSRSAMADTGGTLTSGQVRRPLTVTAILDKIVGD